MVGCLFALLARVALLVVWAQTTLLNRAFHDSWVLPLFGLLFLPVTTLAYVVVYEMANGVTGWAWLWIVLAFLFDLAIHTAGVNFIRTRFAGYRAAHSISSGAL